MNLYYWANCEFNQSCGFGTAIAYSPDVETGIQNILKKCSEEYSYLKDADWEEPDSDYAQKMTEIEQELRSTQPIINPPAIIIEGSD